MKETLYEKSLFISDVHIPFEDKNAVRILKNFTRWFEPDHIFFVGDIIDFYNISTFDKNPERLNQLQNDIDKTVDFLLDMRVIAPQAKMVYLEGNHENRITRYLWKHNEIASLDALSIDKLLDFKDLHIEYKTMKDICTFHDFLIEHGDVIRKYSGLSFKNKFLHRC